MPVRMTLRPATIDDVPQILAFIRALAEYERLLHAVVATEDGLQSTGSNWTITAWAICA